MELWLDTVDFDLIQTTSKQINLHGVTTNPSILAQSELSAVQTIRKLLEIQPGRVAVQVTTNTHQEMIAQAKMVAQIDPRIIIKIPVNQEGLFTINALANANIQTMATAIFETRQVLLSAMAGATYAAPYLSKIAGDQFNEINQMLEVIKVNNYSLKLIVAAIKNVDQILNSAKFGAHAITIPVDPFKQFMANHEQTTQSLVKFANDWEACGKSLEIKYQHIPELLNINP